jgi:hypothetical protein
VNDNPYAPPSETTPTDGALRIHLFLLAVLWLATVFAGWYLFGTSGIAPSVAVVVTSWFALSRTTTAKLRPINRHRMTFVDLITLLAICAILHGLTIPAVNTSTRRAPRPVHLGQSLRLLIRRSSLAIIRNPEHRVGARRNRRSQVSTLAIRLADGASPGWATDLAKGGDVRVGCRRGVGSLTKPYCDTVYGAIS